MPIDENNGEVQAVIGEVSSAKRKGNNLELSGFINHNSTRYRFSQTFKGAEGKPFPAPIAAQKVKCQIVGSTAINVFILND